VTSVGCKWNCNMRGFKACLRYVLVAETSCQCSREQRALRYIRQKAIYFSVEISETRKTSFCCSMRSWHFLLISLQREAKIWSFFCQLVVKVSPVFTAKPKGPEIRIIVFQLGHIKWHNHEQLWVFSIGGREYFKKWINCGIFVLENLSCFGGFSFRISD